MLPVEIVPIENSLVLRARGSELLILPQHVGHLKSCKTPKDFTGYFLGEALLNRPARKLFEAWLRKDNTLWQRIYNTVQKEMTDVPADVAEATEKAPKAEKVAAPKEDKPAKKVAAETKKPEAKVAAAPAKKAAVKKEKEEAPAAKPAKKAAAPKVAKKAEKPATKPAKKAVAAPAKKKPATKAKKKG